MVSGLGLKTTLLPAIVKLPPPYPPAGAGVWDVRYVGLEAAYLSGAINSYSPASTISTDLSTFLE